jgi:hypothetical protein
MLTNIVAVHFFFNGFQFQVVDMASEQDQFGGVIHAPVFFLPDENDIPEVGEFGCA